MSALKSNRGNKTTFSRLARLIDRNFHFPFSFDVEHIAGKNMGWADYMSRNPVRKAHEVSEYDQNVSVAVIQRLKPMVQKCGVKVVKAANQNRHVRKANIQAPANVNAKAKRETFKHSESETKQQPVCALLNKNRMQNQTTNMLNDSKSTISSVPSDYEKTIDSVSGCITAQESTASKEQPEATGGRQEVDQNLVRAIITAMDSRKPEKSEKATEAEEENVITHFSPKLVKTLAQQDQAIQKVIKTLKGTDEDRAERGTHWRALWKDLHITTDGCLFLDNKIEFPVSLKQPFLSYLHATQGGAKVMWEKANYVWFPPIYKSIQAQARTYVECTQPGKNLACFTNVKQSVERPKITKSFDELELDFMGLLNENPQSQRYLIIAVDRYSRLPFAQCCNAPTTDNTKRLLELEKVFGLPKAIRSDQGTAFKAESMLTWCKSKCIKQIFSAIGDHSKKQRSGQRSPRGTQRNANQTERKNLHEKTRTS